MVHTEYGEITQGLLDDLGVQIDRLIENQPRNFVYNPYGVGSGIYFDAGTYGQDKLITGDLLPLVRSDAQGHYTLLSHLDQLSISRAARDSLKRFMTQPGDYLPGVPDEQKYDALGKISYRDFVEKNAGLSPEAARVFARFNAYNGGCGTDALPASWCLDVGMLGMRGLGEFGRAWEKEVLALLDSHAYSVFPDGNASLVRLLVRSLVPGTAPGKTMEDIATARFDYAKLDTPVSRVRVRLNSTAVHVDEDATQGVAVTYVRGGRAYRVRARDCVLACYNAMIPHLCPQLPEPQKAALRYGVKTPMLSTNVFLRSGQAMQKLGASGFYSPNRLHSTGLAFGRSLGSYRYE